jgi:putative protein-disulfide isomerase
VGYFLDSTIALIMSDSSMEIIYVGDPLCSWCWGIAGELQRLRERYVGQASFTLVLGGLRPGGTETNREIGSFLAHHWKQVTEFTGQPISHEILKNEDFIYDTEPPSRAVRVVRELDSMREFDFFKAVQEAFYVRNRDTNKEETYLELCDEFGLDASRFLALFHSDELKKATRDDFAMSAKFGIRSFPTVLLRLGGEFHMLARGYARFEDMDREIQETLSLA